MWHPSGRTELSPSCSLHGPLGAIQLQKHGHLMLFEMPVVFKLSKCERKVTGDLAGSKAEYLRATKFTSYANI